MIWTSVPRDLSATLDSELASAVIRRLRVWTLSYPTVINQYSRRLQCRGACWLFRWQESHSNSWGWIWSTCFRKGTVLYRLCLCYSNLPFRSALTISALSTQPANRANISHGVASDDAISSFFTLSSKHYLFHSVYERVCDGRRVPVPSLLRVHSLCYYPDAFLSTSINNNYDPKITEWTSHRSVHKVNDWSDICVNRKVNGVLLISLSAIVPLSFPLSYQRVISLFS